MSSNALTVTNDLTYFPSIAPHGSDVRYFGAMLSPVTYAGNAPSYFVSSQAVVSSSGTNDAVSLTAAEHFRYLEAYEAIDEMSEAPEWADDAVDEETANEAKRVLLLIQSYEAPAPHLFSHGGDAVVFTWELSGISRYMTVSGGLLGVLDVHRGSKLQCAFPPVDTRGPEMDAWLTLLGASNSQGLLPKGSFSSFRVCGAVRDIATNG